MTLQVITGPLGEKESVNIGSKNINVKIAPSNSVRV